MAIVEEEIPAKPIIVSSASLLYTFPNPHELPSTSHYVPVAACTSYKATFITQEETSSVDRPMETPHLPPQFWTETRSPLVSSCQNIWNPSLRCAGICRISYKGIPCSTFVSTFCTIHSLDRRVNNSAQLVSNHSFSLPMVELMAEQVSPVHPMLSPLYLTSMHYFCKNPVEVYIFMFRILSPCSDSLDIKSCCHLLRFPFVWRNRWRFFSLVQTEHQVSTCSGFHLFGRAGGRPPDMVLLCMITTKF
jgi:hypothetical protein